MTLFATTWTINHITYLEDLNNFIHESKTTAFFVEYIFFIFIDITMFRKSTKYSLSKENVQCSTHI